MKNNRYSLIIILRIILITLNCFALIWIFTQTNRPATTLFFFILLIIQVANLIYFLNRINRDLANFLVFLQENDTTLAFSQKRIERNFKGLIYNLNLINQKLQEARIQREQQHQYLKVVVEHVGIGIIAFNEQGNVEIINNAAKELFGIAALKRTDRLVQSYPELSSVFSVNTKNNPTLIKLKIKNNDLQLSVKSTSLVINDSKIKLLSFQNIKTELEIQELDSWRKLIRILRHEIMNSMTPITTLTTAIRRCFHIEGKKKQVIDIEESNIDDALSSVDVIEERSKGLISFVEKFRSLTDLPKLQISIFHLKKMLQHIQLLFSNEIAAKSISFQIILNNDDLELCADEKLIEQVLINLVKNSIEALPEQGGKITIQTFKNNENRICIQVIDTGMGIKEEALETIFVPSYTTKENGMGIGLSLSKQILQLHEASIHVKSNPGSETVFEIVF